MRKAAGAPSPQHDTHGPLAHAACCATKVGLVSRAYVVVAPPACEVHPAPGSARHLRGGVLEEQQVYLDRRAGHLAPGELAIDARDL